MTDDTIETNKPIPFPDRQAEQGQLLEQGHAEQTNSAPVTAGARLRAFEDEALGENAPRISGQIEKGHGSFFKTKLTDAERRHHEALERLVVAEEKLAHASAAHEAAGMAHEKAKSDVATSESLIEPEPDGERAE